VFFVNWLSRVIFSFCNYWLTCVRSTILSVCLCLRHVCLIGLIYTNGSWVWSPLLDWSFLIFRSSDVASESLLDVSEDCFHLLQAVDLLDDALSVVSLDDWKLLGLVLGEALPERLHVVIGAARRGWPLLDPCNQSVLFDDKVQDTSDIDAFAHDLVPPIEVIFIAREAINQKFALCPPLSLHRLLDQPAGYRDRHNFAFLDDLIDKLSFIRATCHLGSEQVTSWEMDEAAVFDQLGALRSFSSSRSSAERNNRC